MNAKTETLANIEKDITTLRNYVELGEALLNLKENEDFKKLFLEEYTKDSLVRLVELYGSKTVAENEKLKANILEDILGISKFMNYMRAVKAQYNYAKDNLHKAEDYRVQALNAPEEAFELVEEE